MVTMDAAGETDGEVYDLVNEVEESKTQDLFQLRDKIDRFAAIAAADRNQFSDRFGVQWSRLRR